jgi:hypothetical protein
MAITHITNASIQQKSFRNGAKPVKYAVAVILKNSQRSDQFLIVKRPENDPDLRGHWGFPAVTLEDGELLENAAQRVCTEKLKCTAVSMRFIGAMFQKRNNYDILLMDIEMVLIGAREPECQMSETQHTKYVEQRWTTDPLDLMASAKEGSCCSSIFLTNKGMLDKASWIASLEGSGIVG